MGINRGEEVHGEASSADASAGVVLSFFTQGGRSRTIDSQSVVMVTDFNIVSAAGGAVSLLATNGTSTINLFKGTVVANGGAARSLSSPFAVPRGWSLKVKAPAGQCDAQVEGFVIH